MVTITLPDNYGSPLAIAVGVIPLLAFVHGSLVSRLRGPAGVKYPHTHATPEECKKNPAALRFNSAQRAHGNYLENMSQTALSILIAGAKYPKATTVLGISWCVFRTLFMIGYVYSDKPNGMGRSIGMPFWFAQGGLWALAFFGVAWPMMGSILM